MSVFFFFFGKEKNDLHLTSDIAGKKGEGIALNTQQLESWLQGMSHYSREISIRINIGEDIQVII